MLITKESVLNSKDKTLHHLFFLLSNCLQLLKIVYD